MPPEIRIEHRYPAALGFLREHGPQALAVLHELLIRSEDHDGKLVAQASTRDIAEQLGFLSKDTVHRRLRQLARAGVIQRINPPAGATFAPMTYVIHLNRSGITLNGHPSSLINKRPS